MSRILRGPFPREKLHRLAQNHHCPSLYPAIVRRNHSQNLLHSLQPVQRPPATLSHRWGEIELTCDDLEVPLDV
jgi:hypothetical protein